MRLAGASCEVLRSVGYAALLDAIMRLESRIGAL
jgi:hypothetical protein